MIKKILVNNSIIHSMLKRMRRIRFIMTKEYSGFKKSKGYRRLIYLSEIDHGNLGDHAILYAMHNFLKPYEKEFDAVFSFGRKYCIAAIDKIARRCTDKDTVIIPGGGWIGTLWKESGELFITILEEFSECHILVFPQTITFEETDYGRFQEERLYKAIKSAKHLELYVRDRKSYDFLIKKMPEQMEKVQYRLYPDMVLSIKDIKAEDRENDILFVTRKDKEKVIDDKKLDELRKAFETFGYKVKCADTVLDRHISPIERDDALKGKWREFSKARLVITDRLHGMIFSTITKTPCIAFDNINKKVSGVYNEWLRDLTHIQCVSDYNDIENIFECACQLIESKNECEFSSKVDEHFVMMKREVEENLWKK